MLRPWVSQGKRQEALPILYFTFRNIDDVQVWWLCLSHLSH